MHGLLTPEEDAAAALEGWGLHPVYDLDKKKWAVMPLPNPAQTTARIIMLAKTRSPLHIKALRLIQAGFERQPRKKK